MTPTHLAPAGLSDAQLLAADDPDAFREVYERYAEAISGYFLRRTADSTAALDLTAETFARVWFVRDRFRDATDGSAAPWIYGIARNVLLQSIRKGTLERRATQRFGLQTRADSDDGIEDPVPHGGWAEGAEELLDTLPTAQRDAVRLRVLDDLEYPDIARRLGVSEGNARIRVHRGLAALKNHLNRTQENR